MPKFNDVKGVAEKPKKKSAKQVLALTVTGKLVGKIAKYNAAADRAKAAQAEMNELAPDLLAEGLNFVFDHNCESRTDTKKQIKSVNLTEPAVDLPEGQEPEAVQFTWSTRALKCDKDVVLAHLKTVTDLDGKPVDPNKYADEVIVAEFDKKVFIDGKGKFMQARFDRFKAALQTICEELKVENPLSFYKEFKPTGEMNDLRFQQLDTAANLALHLVLPTSTSLEPVRANGEE